MIENIVLFVFTANAMPLVILRIKLKKKTTIQNDIIRFSIQLFVVCVYISYVHGNLENKKNPINYLV